MDRQDRSMLRMVGFLVGLVLAMIMFTPRVQAETVNYLEVGAGYNGSFFAQSDAHEWDDGGGVGATIEMGREWTVPKNEGRLKVKCRWLHVSQWDVGPPFNDRAESSLDHIGCAARLEF